MSTVEIWKNIPEWEGLYQVSNLGNVRSLDRMSWHCRWNKEILTKGQPISKITYKESGYQYVQLWRGKEYKKFKVHRLVALSFIPNPENKPQIDHINTIRNDNRAENLRWVSISENMANPNSKINQSASKIGFLNPRRKIAKSINQINPATNQIVKTWKCSYDAEREAGFYAGNIWRACKTGKPYKGFIWAYVTE